MEEVVGGNNIIFKIIKKKNLFLNYMKLMYGYNN